MTVDFEKLRAENVQRYGTDIGRIGDMLLADRYDERTHFIFELLQNAEDALRRRKGWSGSREVVFELAQNELLVRHHGTPFTDEDVRGICGIAMSTKGLTEIGRFGIGFKSVFVYSLNPEIHSGDASFAIDSYVWPRAIDGIERTADETVIRLPIDAPDAQAREIQDGLRSLDSRSLLFLREIESISWNVGGERDRIAREEVGAVGATGRHVRLAHTSAGSTSHSDWLVFSKDAVDADGRRRGLVEIAFQLLISGDGLSITRVPDAYLVVYFPTALRANVGLLIQAPFQTTPSRDNIPRDKPWNQRVVEQIGELLVQALQELAQEGLLTVSALETLPIEKAKFPESSLLGPLFTRVRSALMALPLLPVHPHGQAAGGQVALARTTELRRLVSSSQLQVLLDLEQPVRWLAEGITQERTPALRSYLLEELRIREVTPEGLFPRMTGQFLEQQSDEWLIEFYSLLVTQPALLKRLQQLPLLRLEGGRHVPARLHGMAQAFRPGDAPSEFPTVKRVIAESDAGTELLKQAGVAQPNPIDEVMLYVLPRYAREQPWPGEEQYATDFAKLIVAFGSDLNRRAELVGRLRQTPFIKAVDQGSGTIFRVEPNRVYISTADLSELLDGLPGVFIVDAGTKCLRGEDARVLLESCGSSRHLETMLVPAEIDEDRKHELRIRAGCVNRTKDVECVDHVLRGLNELLELLPTLDESGARRRAELLWNSLRELLNRRGRAAFQGVYRWVYHYERRQEFEAAFVRKLREACWVPTPGGLARPSEVSFASTGWVEDVFLQAGLQFRPPLVDQLAAQVGIEPAVLDLLKQLKITSSDELRALLKINQHAAAADSDTQDQAQDASTPVDQNDKPATASNATEWTARGDAGDQEGGGSTSGHSGSGKGSVASSGSGGEPAAHQGKFISYVGAGIDDEHECDPESLSHAARLKLEEAAITLIMSHEPQLQRTRTNNTGFDLFELGADGEPARWIEVKAMRGDLTQRPVGLSRSQFELAQRKGDAYWLYVVEHAGLKGAERLLRIKDPAGKARTFTFDAGWTVVDEQPLPIAVPMPASEGQSVTAGAASSEAA